MQIEQRGSVPVEIKIARTIGETVATAEFGLRRIGDEIFSRLNALNPLATNTFTISEEFSPELRRGEIARAVQDSDLPEGIYVAHPLEKDPPKPFVVVTTRPTGDEAAIVYEKGALVDEKGQRGYWLVTYKPDGTPILQKPK